MVAKSECYFIYPEKKENVGDWDFSLLTNLLRMSKEWNQLI
jgi:hypothetical protein